MNDEPLDQSLHPRNCPFCDSWKINFDRREIAEIPGKFAYWLNCANCQATGPVAGSQKDAAGKWGLKA